MIYLNTNDELAREHFARHEPEDRAEAEAARAFFEAITDALDEAGIEYECRESYHWWQGSCLPGYVAIGRWFRQDADDYDGALNETLKQIEDAAEKVGEGAYNDELREQTRLDPDCWDGYTNFQPPTEFYDLSREWDKESTPREMVARVIDEHIKSGDFPQLHIVRDAAIDNMTEYLESALKAREEEEASQGMTNERTTIKTTVSDDTNNTTLSDDYARHLGDAQQSLNEAISALEDAGECADAEDANEASIKLHEMASKIERLRDSLEEDWATDPEIEN